MSENPLLIRDGLPPFDRIEPEHVEPAVKEILSRAGEEVEELERHIEPTWSGVVERLVEIGRPFERGWGPVSHLMGVKNSPELRAAHEQVLPEVVQFSLRAKQSVPIYQALKSIREGDGWSRLDEAQQRIVNAKLLEAELAGVGLPDDKRERFNEIATELSQLSTEFSNYVLDATKAFELVITDPKDAEGLPESLKQLASQSYNQNKPETATPGTPEAGPWRITLDGPSFTPFLQHGRNRALREKVYRAFVSRAASGEWNNEPVIPKILRLRKEQAQLLGYANYAEMSLAEKMAPNVAAVEEMFSRLRSASFEAAKRDMRDLEAMAAKSGVKEPLAHWDLAFWAERLREEKFQYTDEELRPYFSLERVLQGMFELVERIFGVKVVQADGEAPVWHKDVRFFHVLDDSGKQIASFYLDPYSRPENKRGGAWMNDCLGRRRTADGLQLPVAHLICNQTPPVGDKPSLMTFREVETLFHEFGHGLQHMLTRVDYADAAGISGVEWDAVELPSQFMENWCYHKPTLMGMTAHYKTGEPLPDELFEKIKASRTFRSGSMMLRQLFFGMTDMALHTTYDPDGKESPFEIQQRISKQTSVLPQLPEDRSLCSFTHVFAGGYAAGYYSYKWAEVLSADAFAAFEEAGLDNEQAVVKTGRRFRETVLALGGGRHPMDVFRDFRGREPSPEALLRHSGLA